MGLIPNNRSRKYMDRNGLGFAGHYTWISWGNGVDGAIQLVFLNSTSSINMSWIGKSISYLAWHTLISSQLGRSQCSNELTQPDAISLYYPESPHYLSQLPFADIIDHRPSEYKLQKETVIMMCSHLVVRSIPACIAMLFE